MADLISYYAGNPNKGWLEGFTRQLNYEIIGPEIYRLYITYLPKVMKKKLKLLRSWFRALDNYSEIPYEFRRRHSVEEVIETALLTLSKIDTIINAGGIIYAGSEHICPVAWCIFGRSDSLSRKNLEDINDIRHNYKDFLKGDCYGQIFHIRDMGSVPLRLGVKHNMTANLVIAIAVLLLTDIILNCGPDCVEMFDLFNNDYRNELNSSISEKNWLDARNKTFGNTEVRKTDKTYKPPDYYKPNRIFYNKTVKITELPVESTLSSGERTVRTILPSFCVSFEEKNSENLAISPDEELANKWNKLGFEGLYK